MSDPGVSVSSDEDPVAEVIDEEIVPPISTRDLMVTLATAGVPLAAFFVLPFDGRGGRVLALIMVLGTVALMLPLSIHQARTAAPQRTSAARRHPLPRCSVTGDPRGSVLGRLLRARHQSYDHQIERHPSNELDALYFTVTVMATVGFGDITADRSVERAGPVTGQMVVNFAILAVALRLVSWALREREGGATARRRLSQPPGSRRSAPARRLSPRLTIVHACVATRVRRRARLPLPVLILAIVAVVFFASAAARTDLARSVG